MPYYNENTVYYRRLTASYGDVQLPPLGTTPDVVSATPCQNHSRKAKGGSRGRRARPIPRSSALDWPRKFSLRKKARRGVRAAKRSDVPDTKCALKRTSAI